MNRGLIRFYSSLRGKVKLYVFTSKYIQEYPPLKEELVNIFDAILSAKDLGIIKDNSKSYRKIVEIIHLQPREILYIDDNPDNIEAAKKLDLQIIKYQTNESLIGDINSFLANNIN